MMADHDTRCRTISCPGFLTNQDYQAILQLGEWEAESQTYSMLQDSPVVKEFVTR